MLRDSPARFPCQLCLSLRHYSLTMCTEPIIGIRPQIVIYLFIFSLINSYRDTVNDLILKCCILLVRKGYNVEGNDKNTKSYSVQYLVNYFLSDVKLENLFGRYSL